MRRLAKLVGDHPWFVSLVLVAAVAAHALVVRAGLLSNPWVTVTDQTVDSQVSLHLGLAGVAAVVAGFAGVVVVFVLQSASPRFRRFRQLAPRGVRSTSLSIVAAPMGSAVLALACGLLVMGGYGTLAMWGFELGLLVLFHGLLRTMAFFRSMIKLVQYDDAGDLKDERKAVHAGRASRERGGL